MQAQGHTNYIIYLKATYTMTKMNPIYHLQKWMDTFAGQTFMQYAYSWGAAVVILGTLFKLTHIPGANLMLFIGMGTEVFVFFIAGFERVTEKVPDNPQQQAATAQGNGAAGNAPIIIGGGIIPVTNGEDNAAKGDMEGSMAGENVEGSISEGMQACGMTGEGGSASGVVLTATAHTAGMTSDSSLAGLANLATLAGQATLNTAAIQATDPSSIEDAVKNYAEELTQLTEVLGRVKVQAERMSTDSEEMENLNRTLTGIATVYELQLRNISKQVSTIEQIDEQTKRMAKQIEELNNVYARMIAALTVNMGGNVPPANNQ